MAEGITHSQKNTVLSYTEKHTVAAEQHEHKIPAHDGSTYSPSPPANEQTSIIWTPRFITTFFLVLVLGLSATSVFTQGYANSYFPGEWVLLAGCTLIFAMWTGTAVITKDLWARLGAVFGCVWILFVAANLVASLFAAPPGAAITTHGSTAANLALFACYLCLSSNRIPMRRWDTWFLRLVPIVAAGIVIGSFVFARPGTRSVHSLENALAITTLLLSTCMWWLRPSCWRYQPGVAFLLGIAPLFLLLPPELYAFYNTASFSYFQISLVFFLLGILRIAQGERQQRKAAAQSILLQRQAQPHAHKHRGE